MSKELPPQFKRFDRTNTYASFGRSSGPAMSMSAAGAFRITKVLAEKMQLREGAGVVLLRDDTQEQWYLQRDDKNGLELREDKNGNWLFNSAVLRKAISATIEGTPESGSIPVAEAPTKVAGISLWPMFTNAIKQRFAKD